MSKNHAYVKKLKNAAYECGDLLPVSQLNVNKIMIYPISTLKTEHKFR